MLGLNVTTSCLRTWEVSKNELGDILDMFWYLLNLIKGSVSFSCMQVSQKLNLAKWAEKEFPGICYQNRVRIKDQYFLFAHFNIVEKCGWQQSRHIVRLFKCNEKSFLLFLDARKPNIELTVIIQKTFPIKMLLKMGWD